MDRFKSIIKTLGFWLVFIAAAVFGFGSMGVLTEKNGLSSVAGWVFVGITLSLLVFLFIARRQSFRIVIAILIALWLMVLPGRIAALHIGGDAELNIIFYLSVTTILYFWGAYLITKQRLLKIIGVLLILAVSFAGALLTTMPDYSRLTMVLNRVVWALMAGMGIFMVIRKGIGLRLLGVSLIIVTTLTVFMAIFSYSSPTAITGKDRTIILTSVEPRINDLFQAWNDKNYQKLSENFNDEMRENYDRDKFLSVRNELGKLISRDELRKLAPKSDSPSVAVETKFIKIMYGARFEKHPVAIYLITVYFLKYDNKYLIGGLTFDPVNLPK